MISANVQGRQRKDRGIAKAARVGLAPKEVGLKRRLLVTLGTGKGKKGRWQDKEGNQLD